MIGKPFLVPVSDDVTLATQIVFTVLVLVQCMICLKVLLPSNDGASGLESPEC